jgi:hypothetical protein
VIPGRLSATAFKVHAGREKSEYWVNKRDIQLFGVRQGDIKLTSLHDGAGV